MNYKPFLNKCSKCRNYERLKSGNFLSQLRKEHNMKTVLRNKDKAIDRVLYLAMELNQKKWKLRFSNGDRTRIRTLAARKR